MTQRNLVIIMMDELARDGVGCYGGVGLTTHIDRLAARGCRFTSAYTPSPVCVPARAAFQSGLYVFQNRCWSNAQPYTGVPRGWAHCLRDAGYRTTSIGKLHYRCSEDDNGYEEELEALHVKDGEGWVYGLLRRQDHTAFDASGYAAARGPGEDGYSDYDRRVRDAAVNWLRNESAPASDRPFALFVSFLRPHYPLTCPREFYDLYELEDLPPIRFDGAAAEYRHPVLNAFRAYNDFDNHFPDDAARNIARASYFGLCSFVDALVGDVLCALEQAGRLDDTVIVLTADHGDMNGHRGLWTKMVMYEDSVGIPLIVAGPGVRPGERSTQASLIDVHQTALEAAGMDSTTLEEGGRGRGEVTTDVSGRYHGRSLLALANAADDPTRCVFSEYHDGGSITGYMMLREGRWKYVAYAGFAPQLFDLESDPFEGNDLGLSDRHRDIRQRLHNRMCREFDDPQTINALAFEDQAARIEALGGLDGIYARANYDHTPVE